MKKTTKLTALLGAGALLFNVVTTPVMAGPFGGHIGIGVAATAASVDTTATELLKNNNTNDVTAKSTSVSKSVVGGYDSYWAQYTFGDNGFVVGYEKIGRDLSIGSGLRQTDETAEQDAADALRGQQIVKAAISNHKTWYIESPGLGFDGGIFGGNGGLFLKYSQSSATLKTMENLHTGASYGDGDLTGDTMGIGFKTGTAGGVMFKVAYEFTEYDSVSISSTGSDAVTKISSPGSEIDAIKVSLGYSF